MLFRSIFVSCSVAPSSAFTTSIHISALSIASFDLIILNSSILSFIFDFFLIPAVSINVYLPCSFSTGVSTASLVVPAILLTIFLFDPIILFIREDLPTLGFPISAIFILSSSFSSTCFSGRRLTI